MHGNRATDELRPRGGFEFLGRQIPAAEAGRTLFVDLRAVLDALEFPEGKRDEACRHVLKICAASARGDRVYAPVRNVFEILQAGVDEGFGVCTADVVEFALAVATFRQRRKGVGP